jgi:hypothetical protein
MSSTPSINTVALQEILLGLADGLNDAQRKLRSMAPYDEYGRPNTLYQVPYMDFTLQVTTEFQSVVESSGVSTAKVLFQTAPKSSTTSTTTNNVEIFSSISGRFVAVLPNDGLPQTVIQVITNTPVADGSFYDIKLDVYLSNTAGEKLVNSLVEFNYDDLASQPFNTGLPAGPAIMPTFSEAEVYTDANGLCSTVVTLKKSEYDSGRFFLFTVNSGPVVKTISINNL